MGIGQWAADQAKHRATWAVMTEGQKRAYLQRQARLAALHENEAIKQQYRAPVEEQRRLDAERREAERRADAERRDAERALDSQRREYGETEKLALGRPRTEYTGGVGTAPLTVTHHRASMPVAFLPPDGVTPRVIPAARHLVVMQPELAHDAKFMAGARESDLLFREVNAKYGLFLGRLNNTQWWQELTDSVGITQGTVTEETWSGNYASGIRKLTTVAVPVISGVRVSEEPWSGNYASGVRKLTTVAVPVITGVRVAADGLRVRVAHRPGDSGKSWAAKLDPLKAAFRAAGADARHLTVTEDSHGNIGLDFGDAEAAFPAAIAPEPPESAVADRADALRRYHSAEWVLGIDARGKSLGYPMKRIPHVLVSGGTGGGKWVWARSTIVMLRTNGFTCFIGSGKVSDFAALEGLPGVAMVAGDPAQTAVMVRTVRQEMERRNSTAAEAKRAGDSDAFNFPPILLLLDEWGATEMQMKATFKKSDPFTRDIDLLLRVGREARVHVALLSQTIRKTGEGAVPGSWQENLGLTVALGSPSEITIQSDAFTDASRDRARIVGGRLKGKQGRGLTAERETGRVVEFQSFYGWSPGTTSLDPAAAPEVRPPTPEVRAAWERWVPVSDSVPPIMPRLGIKAMDPGWAANDLDAVAGTPTVPLTDSTGSPIPDRTQFDPASPEWLGRPAAGHHRGIDFDAGSPASRSGDVTPAIARTGRLSPAAVRAEALRLGLIDADDDYAAPPEPVPTTPATAPPATETPDPETPEPETPEPKRKPTPKFDPDAAGDF